MPQKTFYKQGDIVLIAYPYSDLSSSKKRPALVLNNQPVNNNYILAQITSSKTNYPDSLFLTTADVQGELKVASQVRSAILFTAHKSIILRKICALQKTTTKRVITQLLTILQA